MRNRFLVVLSGMALSIIVATPSRAEEKILALMDPTGRVLYTNLADNSPKGGPTQPIPVVAVPEATPDPIHALIDSIAGTHGVDPALVKAMVKAESNFNRWAISSKGALGLMQLIPNTGARFGVRDFFDPKQNIEGGVRYIKFLLDKFNGDLDLSLAAYNAGENLVERLGRVPSYVETRNYVRKVRAQYGKPPVAVAPVKQVIGTPVAAAPPAPARQEIFRTVDERGIVYFSNVAPPK